MEREWLSLVGHAAARAAPAIPRPLERKLVGVPAAEPRPGAQAREPEQRAFEQRASAAVGELAHDLRGLLTVVKGYAELLQEDTARQEDPLPGTFCQKILRSCALMQELVENCLDLSRIQSGHLSVRTSQVDLLSAVEQATSGAALRARSKEITLVVDLPRPVPTVETDATFLERILDNLLGNAIKFSPPRSVVQVLARGAGPFLELAVSDQGPGLEIAQVPVLFEAYRRGPARPTGGERTTGLGLAIVKELVSALGGSIAVRSAPGAGATFIVALPRR